METTLAADSEKLTPTSGLTIVGNLQLDQLVPLPSHGTHSSFGDLLVNESRSDAAHYDPSEIILRNAHSNYTACIRR